MNNKFLNTALAGLILSVSCLVNVANAGLIVDIVDDGNGFAKFSLSGSSTNLSPYHQAGDGAWVHGYNSVIGLFDTSFSGGMYTLSNNTSSFSVNGSQVATFTDIRFSQGIDGLFGLITSTNIQVNSNVAFSWAGEFNSNMQYSTFNSGTYAFDDWGYYFGHRRALEGGYTINVGNVSTANNDPTNVPEPSTLAIFALGIMGLASRRFKKQA